MICKCPKCKEFATAINATTLERMYHANNQAIEETREQGAHVSEAVTGIARKLFGDFFGGKVVGTYTETVTEFASLAGGHGLGMLKSLSQLLHDGKDSLIIICPKKHETLINTGEVTDESDEFFKTREQELFLNDGLKYIVINPEASVAYPKESKLYVLRKAPDGFIFPKGNLQFGEVYCNHPAAPMEFFPLETYRFDVIKEELLDLATFLTSLGAKRVHVVNKVDIEQYDRQAETTNINSKTKVGDKKLDVEFTNKEDASNYSKLANFVEQDVHAEYRKVLNINEDLYNKWAPVRPEWRNLREQRLAGALNCRIVVSSNKMTNAYKSELNTVSAQYSQYGCGESATCSLDAASEMIAAKDISYTIDVVFYPEHISLFNRIINFFKSLF